MSFLCPTGTVERAFDETLPGGPRLRTITHRDPWRRCDREIDYARTWVGFALRLGWER